MSVISQYQAAPSLPNDVATVNNVRSMGGIFPEQQTFLGATIKSFSIQNGSGSSPATLNVELIEDPENNNAPINDPSRSAGIYDPYHNNSYDVFAPPGVGMPVFFVYSNPRRTIQQAYDPAFVVKSYESILKFGGILQSFHATKSISGRTFSATVVDPREILSSVYLILNNADDKVGLIENNVLNIFGFLEYNLSSAQKAQFSSWTNNVFRRNSSGTQFGGDDMYYLTPTAINANASYFDALANKFPITGTGMSRRSTYGMPYYRIMQGIAALSSPSLPDIYQGFFGSIFYRGLKYQITMTNLPDLFPTYFFDHDNIDLLSFILEIAEATSHEIIVSLEPVFDASATSGTAIGGKIVISFINRTNEAAIGQINAFINDENNFPSELIKSNDSTQPILREKIIEKQDIGYELANPTTSRIVFGANRVDLHAFTSNHDRSRYNRIINNQGNDMVNPYVDQIIPYYGTIGENCLVPTKGRGEWTQILLDSSTVGAFGVGNYYIATEAELRYALKGFNSWKNFLEFFSGKYLDILNMNQRAKHQDVLLGPLNAGLVVNDDVTGLHLKCLKVPRSLFTNDSGWIGGELINPCCPPYGYPLYYNRAVAIGLTMKRIFDERDSVIADLRALQISNGDPVKLQKIINRLLEKYKQLSRIRRLTAVEIDAVKALDSQRPGLDSKYIDSIISSLSGQIYVPSKNKTTRAENAAAVFNFVKSVADECYGKKWLVRIPNNQNPKFYPATDSNNGITLSGGGKLYESGFFGFAPTVNGNVVRSAISTGSFVQNSNTVSNIPAVQPPLDSALSVNYNPIDDALIYNYIPDSTGGFVNYDLYLLGVNSALIPKDLKSFGSSHRIKAYVRYDHAEKLNLSSNTKCYTEKAETLHRIKAIPSKSIPYDDFTAVTTAATVLAYIPVDVETQLYFLEQSVSRSVGHFGAYTWEDFLKTEPVTLDASGELPANAGSVKIRKEATPNFQKVTDITINDYPRNADGRIIPSPDINYAFALITMPEMVSLKYDNIGELPKRYQYSVGTYPGQFMDEQSLNTVGSIKVNRRIDFGNFGGSLTFYNPDRLFSSPVCIKPDIVVLPLENQQKCYGPWYTGPIRYKNSNNQYEYKLMKNIGGKVDIETDTNLAPWNFGSYELMEIAGNSRAQLANTLYLASEKGSVTFPGLPMGKREIGHIVAESGPMLESVNLDVSVDGVHTTYRFQTYSRSFALLQKQQQKAIDYLKSTAKKNGEKTMQLMHSGFVKQKFRGSAPPAQTRKPYESPVNPYYINPTPYNTVSASVVVVPNTVGGIPSNNNTTEFQSASTSSSHTQEMYNQDDDTLNQGKDYYCSATQDNNEKFIPVAKQDHHAMPYTYAADLESRENLYSQPSDPYILNNHQITYWS